VAPLIPGAGRRLVEIETADAGQLRLQVAELGEGPPVLLLHGWPQHSGCWRYVAPLLAEHHRVICPDNRGFGGSDAPGRGYDPQTFAADAIALLDALEVPSAFLVGHDWGGFAGFLACFSEPDRIQAFVALNTPTPWVRPSPRLLLEAWRSWYAMLMASPVLSQLILRQLPDLVGRGMVRDVVHDLLTEEDGRAYAQQLARPHSAHATEQLYRFYLLRAITQRGRWGSQRLVVPTRLLFGERDGAVPTLAVRGHEGHADDMEVELVPDSGHFIPEEKPELIAERALELFGRVRSSV
jgi:pimeloyl-ACP methyl ester carboxylesterase